MDSEFAHRSRGPRAKRHPFGRRSWLAWAVALLLVLGSARAILPWAVRHYVNRTLDKSVLYTGRIGDLSIHLWRGAYAIHDVRILKAAGASVPVPLFACRRVDFAVQWNALLEGKLVGRMLMDQPTLSFVDAGTDEGTQTGAGGPWLEMIQDLFPFRINQAVVRGGAIHFRAIGGETPVDVYLSRVNGVLDNLTNIRDETAPLVSTVQATALAMDQAEFEYKMTLDPFSYRPTFQMAVRLLGLDVTKLNDLARVYGKLDFEKGWFDLVIEAEAREGTLTGYVKPLFRELEVFSVEDLGEKNVLELFWEALVGAATSIFKNHPRDQFGTLIPFEGDVSSSTTADLLATLGNVLRNAFVRAYLPRLEGGNQEVGGLRFSPPDLQDSGAGVQTQ